MRVIAGKYRSRKLESPLGETTRPTLDQVKESFFNSIGQYFNQGKVLDLFAGSGNIGIECLSRGFDHAVFVDSDANAINTIRKNVSLLKLEQQSTIIHASYNDALNQLKGQVFDLVYLDPPYANEQYYQDSITMLINNGCINENTLIACEALKDTVIDVTDLPLTCVKDKMYRKNRIIMYKLEK